MKRRIGRQRNARRKTPRLDAWMEQLRPHLAPRGAKSELARFLAEGDPDKVAGWNVTIQKILNRATIAGGEFVLAAQDWMQAKIPSLRKDKSTTK